MVLELRQSMKLVQQLVMTPQLQQAIKLLQLSRLELVSRINQELQENPTLEEVQPDDSDTFLEAELAAGPDSRQSGEAYQEAERPRDVDWDEYLQHYDSYYPRTPWEDNRRVSFEATLTKKTSLYDHLIWQMHLMRLTPEENEVAEMIIGNLNEDGYLECSLEEIAAGCGADTQFVEKVLHKVQEFDPAGVAARDLKECLMLQVRMLGIGTGLVDAIIKDHLKDLEKKRHDVIARKLGVSLEEVLAATRIITNLEPRPGRAYAGEEPLYITPDVYVYKIDDDYVVIVNEDGMPKLRISPYYKHILANRSSEEAREYIHEKLRSAAWLIKSIHQRRRTIYKVACSIVKFQREFLDKGVDFLRPLVLRDVAEDINMHESTISRVTTNKYMHTPQGILEMKYFFKSSIHQGAGEKISSESVKERIRQIVAKEDPQRPISDQEIVNILKKANIDVARRTVAKYREHLGILPSTKRKKVI
jgi:RNA polymerase sigma-54 factor